MSEEGIICLIDLRFTSDVEGEDWFVVTRCGHTFHNSCMKTWIGEMRTKPCPVCNENVIPSDLLRLHGINPTKRRTLNGTTGSTQDDYSCDAVNLSMGDLAVSKRDPDYTFKIILLGGTCVGKSSLIERYTEGTFHYMIHTTVGVPVAFKRLEIGGKLIKLILWDTCGQERFRAVSGNFARNVHGALLVYSYSKWQSDSLGAIRYWIDFLKKQGVNGNEAAMVLVGNKSDTAPEDRGITSEQGHEFAKKNALSLYETSAMDDLNVDAVFKALVVDVMDKVESNKLKHISEREREAQGRIQIVPCNNQVRKTDSCLC